VCARVMLVRGEHKRGERGGEERERETHRNNGVCAEDAGGMLVGGDEIVEHLGVLLIAPVLPKRNEEQLSGRARGWGRVWEGGRVGWWAGLAGMVVRCGVD